MKGSSPESGSGKTKFNSIKSKGQSWAKLRNQAITNGTWVKEPSKKEGK